MGFKVINIFESRLHFALPLNQSDIFIVHDFTFYINESYACMYHLTNLLVLLVKDQLSPSTNYRQVPIIANLHVTREHTRICWPFFADDNNKWWQIRLQHLTIVSWLIKKKSGKTPLENNTSLYKLRGNHVNGAECQSICNSNNIADWCSNDRQILVTPSCFAVRLFLLTSLLINIYFPTSNKMAITGTLPSRFCYKNQQLYKGSLIRACA